MRQDNSYNTYDLVYTISHELRHAYQNQVVENPELIDGKDYLVRDESEHEAFNRMVDDYVEDKMDEREKKKGKMKKTLSFFLQT